MDGYNFRLYGDIKDTMLFPTIYRAEEKGETVNDAVFNRNKAVEERFKIKITHVQSAGDVHSLYKDAITNVSAGDDFADLVCGEIKIATFLGDFICYEVRLSNGQVIQANQYIHLNPKMREIGEKVALSIENMNVFTPDGKEALL